MGYPYIEMEIFAMMVFLLLRVFGMCSESINHYKCMGNIFFNDHCNKSMNINMVLLY